MKHTCHFLFSLLLFILFASCTGQTNRRASANNRVDTPGSAILQNITSTDTSAGWFQPGQKLMLTGVVYKPDSKTPAPGVVVYYYQTNTAGRYLHKPEEKRSMPPNVLGQTHGYIRGWVKTGNDGKYTIYTIKPGPYPDGTELAHIHLTVKEPGDPEYYIDDIVFDDDKLMTTKKRLKMENRGGSGVVRLIKKDSLLIGERNIFLSLNIPGYPKNKISGSDTGKKIGEDIMSFTPTHAWGPDKGSKACPVCKYGRYHGILYFVGNKPNWIEIKQWLTLLEAESKKRGKYLKVYFIYGNEIGYDKEVREKELENIGKELQIENTALTFVPSFSDIDSDIYLTRINANSDNSFLLYKRSNVIDKYINLKPTEENFHMILNRLDETINEYFEL